MSPRTLVLVVGAVAVLGLGVYLFVEVRTAPASPSTTAVTERPAAQGTREIAPAADPPEDSGGRVPPKVAPVTDRPPIHLGTADVAPPTQAPVVDERANPKLDSIMDEANKAYDRQDFEEAKAIAGKVLSKQPANIRMLRVMVSSACVDGDKDTAQKYFEQLPKFDRDQMKLRCDRYGIAFKDPTQ